MTKLGRLSDSEKMLPIVHDDPSQQMKAVMSKLDELIGAVKALTAKLDADGGVTDTDYAALITNAIKEIELKL